MTFDLAWLKKTAMAYMGWDAGGVVEEMLPDIIRMAEVRMQQDLRLRQMERTGYRMTVPGDSDVWLPEKRIPGDWDVFMDMREVCLEGSPNVNMAYAAPDLYTDISSTSGTPGVYTIIGHSLRLAPVPDKPYKILLTYYAEIPPLSDKQPTNDLLLSYPNLYLYATLVESAGYLRTSVPAQDWVSLYTALKIEAQYKDRRARFSKNIAARPPRRAVV